MWRGQPNDIPNDDARQRYIRKLVDQRRGPTTSRCECTGSPTGGHATGCPLYEPDWFEVRAGDGTVLRSSLPPFTPPMPSLVEIRLHTESQLERMNEAFARFAEVVEALPRVELPRFEVQRGGIDWNNPGSYWREDPRQGDEVYVYDLLPGCRVYVLEDVFTVDRVDMQATLPTVWLKELPTSPLYFTEDESIYLANETEDQP